MGNSPSRECVGFGIEIELSGIPKAVDVLPNKVWDYKRAGYQDLKSAMERRDMRTTMDPIRSNGGFTKHHGDYDMWHLTQDNSIKPRDTPDAISIEAVSRVFYVPRKDWMDEIQRFWGALDATVRQEMNNHSCGSHVHVRPMGSGYTLEELRRIAYAVVVYEKHVLEFLPEERRNAYYCMPNTSVSPGLKRIFRGRGRSRDSYDDLKYQIEDIDTKDELCELMQGNQNDSRRVLWNFDNVDNTTGTVEFRGGPGLQYAKETKHWILFALGFILLAIEEDKLSEGNFTYVAPGTQLFEQRAKELWVRIRSCAARKVTQKVLLPLDYNDMMVRYESSEPSSRTSSPVSVDDSPAEDSPAEDSPSPVEVSSDEDSADQYSSDEDLYDED